MTQTITHKSGDTFWVNATYADPAGVGIPLTGYSIRSQIRTLNNVLIADLLIALEDQVETPGKYSLSCADTSAWRAGVYRWDIEYRFGTTVVSTDTVQISVQDDVTR